MIFDIFQNFSELKDHFMLTTTRVNVTASKCFKKKNEILSTGYIDYNKKKDSMHTSLNALSQCMVMLVCMPTIFLKTLVYLLAFVRKLVQLSQVSCILCQELLVFVLLQFPVCLAHCRLQFFLLDFTGECFALHVGIVVILLCPGWNYHWHN